MLKPFTTVIQKVIVYAALAAVVALAALAGILWWRLSVVQGDLDTCAKQRSELEGKVKLQSQEIEDWGIAWEVAQEKGRRATAQARQAASAAAARGDDLQRQILAGAGTSCEDAMAKVRAGWK